MNRTHIPHSFAWSVRLTAICILLGGQATSCFVADGARHESFEQEESVAPPDAPRPSKLVVRWSVDGQRHSNECVKTKVREIQVRVSDFEREVGTWRHHCDAFVIAITLEPGDYSASAVLVDGARGPRTMPVRLDHVRIGPNGTVEHAVDFPGSSFLAE